MKKNSITNSILMFLMLLPLTVSSQNPDGLSRKRNELNICIDDIFAKNSPDLSYFAGVNNSSINNENNSSMLNYYNSIVVPKVGLGYKFHLGKGAIRSKITYGSSTNKYKDNISSSSTNQMSYDNSIFNITGGLGYEFHVDIDKTQFFTGLDIFVNYSKYSAMRSIAETSSNYSYVTHQFEATPYTISNEYAEEHLGYGVSPFIGIKYFISPMVSVSTEMKFYVEYFEDSGSLTYSNTDPFFANFPTSVIRPKHTGFNTKFGPLGQVSVNIHF